MLARRSQRILNQRQILGFVNVWERRPGRAGGGGGRGGGAAGGGPRLGPRVGEGARCAAGLPAQGFRPGVAPVAAVVVAHRFVKKLTAVMSKSKEWMVGMFVYCTVRLTGANKCE